MNRLELADLRQSAHHYYRFRIRILDRKRRATTFSRGGEPDALQRIYVINLDRRSDRWKRVRRELDRFRDRHGHRLSSVTRRFSAVDARYMATEPDSALLIPRYTLADQLRVDPNPLLRIDDATRAREIMLTQQEIAIALSHIELWKLIAGGDVPSALVLEDDVFMVRGFAPSLKATWNSLGKKTSGEPDFDMLYLAFKEVGNVAAVERGDAVRRLRQPGIWEASGYVLSREGASKLLDALPVYGPVDLWLNLQFHQVRAYTSARPIIEQRIDEPTTNSYSVLPVLSQVGVITREKPLLAGCRRLPGPVIAVGGTDCGLTALGTALSMLGYTCCSNLDRLPAAEEEALLAGTSERRFNAYVNIGSLTDEALARIARVNPDARLILTSTQITPPIENRERLLLLGPDTKDKWAKLSDFLGIEYPAFTYPAGPDHCMRALRTQKPKALPRRATDLKADAGPWILKATRRNSGGIVVESPPRVLTPAVRVDWSAGDQLDATAWKLRDDTFPSNLALFAPTNVTQSDGEARLTLRQEQTAVRELTSGSIASAASYLYGSFKAELRPPRASGLITGMFLHRNGPRQEIDIEFPGKDTTKMIVNVFYNPGPEGTKLEYGYRGAPTAIDLGFDAADDFHTYEIDWQPNGIRWLVDGELVYERALWDPTPIPDQPLQFNLNLWHSRSKEFAGRLDATRLPVSASVRSIEIAVLNRPLDTVETSPAIPRMTSVDVR